jgi:hypothetical protein
MAENHAQAAEHPIMDYAKHEKAYRLLFFPLIKYTMAGAALILALVIFCG